MSKLAEKQAAFEIHNEAQASVPAKVERDEPTSLLAVISRAASDPNCDVEKMRALLEMRRELEHDDARRQFAEDMVAAKAEMPAVVRDAENKETHSRWARLETVAAAIDPILSKHGFSISYGTYDAAQEGHYGIVAKVMHKAGHSEEYRAPVPADLAGPKGTQNKSKTHAFGSTMSYGRRYLKLMIFDVVTKGDDDDGNAAGAQRITPEQVQELSDLCDQYEVDKIEFCKFGEIEGLADISTKNFAAAKQAILAKGKAQAKAKADA